MSPAVVSGYVSWETRLGQPSDAKNGPSEESAHEREPELLCRKRAVVGQCFNERDRTGRRDRAPSESEESYGARQISWAVRRPKCGAGCADGSAHH